jgi:hypothetical protein
MNTLINISRHRPRNATARARLANETTIVRHTQPRLAMVWTLDRVTGRLTAQWLASSDGDAAPDPSGGWFVHGLLPRFKQMPARPS